jgi:hypothetical protein
MYNSGKRSGVNPATVAMAGLLLAVAIAVLAAGTARAADYKMVLCAGNNGPGSYQTATNTAYSKYPSGIFNFENYCRTPSSDPAGNDAFLRMWVNTEGTSAEGAYGSISWTTTPWVNILAAGGYIRESPSFSEGWRARFWAEGWDGSTNNVLMQGVGVANGSLGGVGWAPCTTFCSHLWPFGGYGSYRRVVFEVTCYRAAGCNRSGWNLVDANSFVFTLADTYPLELWLTNTSAPLLSGQWVRGTQTATYAWSDQGSGIRMEWVDIDGARQFTIDHASECAIGSSGVNGVFALGFQPCSTAIDIGRADTVDTAALPDGAHTLQACGQDFAQWQGLDGTGGASCQSATIRTDNTPPGAPSGLVVTSSNPARYLDHFGAQFSLPPNAGSPIAKVHYYVTDGAGKVVVPERVVSATNPTSLSGIEGPAKAGAYTLHLSLEDQVGFLGPAATAPIPHDTTPPAAPQGLEIVGHPAHRVSGVDLRWQNVTDAGSPIGLARYEILDASGKVVAGPGAASGEGIEAIHGIETPAPAGDYKARVWLEDEEGNAGAPATVALPRDTTPPAAPQDVSVTAPAMPRSGQAFDVRWRDLTDAGSPIDAVHYRILNGAGEAVVAEQTIAGTDPQAIEDLEAPRGRGSFTLQLWLSDAEGNVGAPVSVPLSYRCERSEAGGASSLGAAVSGGGKENAVVEQGSGGSLGGRLTGAGGAGVANAALCVFSRVLTEGEPEFLGLALTDDKGGYSFPVPAGPSRALSAVYRDGNREITGEAELDTRVSPTFAVRRKVVHNEGVARFEGQIPGPDNDGVVVVVQVRRGNGWLAFHRYRTRDDGRFLISYRFTRTERPTLYEMRAQVREQVGYPYLQGTSEPLKLVVLPARGRRR